MTAKRSFNGCWTCRYRKVKCDASRPKCSRCEKSGLECEGYDIKLTFSHITSVKKGKLLNLVKRNEVDDKFYRRVIKFSAFPRGMLYETYSQLDSVIETLDKRVSSGNNNAAVGPFSVYEPAIQPRSSNVHQILNNDDYTDNIPEIANEKSGDSLIHADLISLAKLSIYGIKGTDYKVNDQNIFHILYPTFYPNIDSDEWLPQGDYMSSLVHSSSDGVVASHTYQRLVQAFNGMRLAFIKLNHPNNVWDRVVRPYLQCLLFEFLLQNNLEEPVDFEEIEESPKRDTILKTNLKLILNLLILSIASFNNSKTKYSVRKNDDIDSDLKLSIFLRKKALTLLNNHLDGYDDHCNIDEEYDLLLLLSIILQVEIDSYFNIFENFDLLFAIGDFITKQEKPTKGLKHLHLVTKGLFVIMNTFFLSTQNINVYNYRMNEDDLEMYEDLKESYDLIGHDDEEEDDEEGKVASDDSEDEENKQRKAAQRPTIITNSMTITVSFESSKGNAIIKDNELQTDEALAEDFVKEEGFDPDPAKYDVDANHVHMLYGIPQSLMNLFYRVINLTNHKRVFETEKKYPRNFPKICTDVEEILDKWTIKWKLTNDDGPISEECSFISQFHRIVFLNIVIFHTCLKVYFKRLIKNEIHQHLIERVLADIARLEELSRGSSAGVEIRPIFWSILICGSDNLNKLLNGKFLELANKFDNITYWRSRQLMYEVWNRRDLGEESNWMDMIREWDIVLYLG